MKSDINNERIRKDCYTILFGFNKRWERVIKKKDGMTFFYFGQNPESCKDCYTVCEMIKI